MEVEGKRLKKKGAKSGIKEREAIGKKKGDSKHKEKDTSMCDRR